MQDIDNLEEENAKNNEKEHYLRLAGSSELCITFFKEKLFQLKTSAPYQVSLIFNKRLHVVLKNYIECVRVCVIGTICPINSAQHHCHHCPLTFSLSDSAWYLVFGVNLVFGV